LVDVDKFKYMKIGLASADTIRKWSYGEVKKSETINYRTLKPEKDGLFCERIFGPQKDCECACGKYKRIRHEGIVCDRCGVEVTVAKVRRERMGHIELAAPVAHIWYVKGIPSRMGLLLNMSPRELEEVIYFVNYVVIDPGKTDLIKQKVLTEKEYREAIEKWGYGSFQAGMGAEAIKQILQTINLDKLAQELRGELKVAQGQKRGKVIKRLDVVESFHNSGNTPDWMILDVLPVIPPEIRPMVQLDGGRFATSDLNDLYRRVINRNNRLIRYLEIGAPNIIINNEKRMIQEAVDALIDNGRRGRPVTGPGNRPLKSLSHMLKGKQGRFRQNLLGKRVDYSGRSVIVVGPDLKMYQCGLPKEMALELFKPFVMKELVERELAQNIKSAKKMIERMDDALWDVVEDVIREHPVLLNRAPTLHRLGIQAFEPKIVEGRAIRLHPLVTTAFNADFDGDQMAVHVPLSQEAQAEARLLMLAANNILNPKDGKPVVTPSQDMVLGNYYLTMETKDARGEGNIYKDTNELMMAYANGYVELHSRVAVNARSLNNMTFTEEKNQKYLITTLGKVVFNSILPETFPYLNEPTLNNLQKATPDQYFVEKGTDIKAHLETTEIVSPFKKKFLGDIISEVFRIYKTTETSRMLDRLKDLGFRYSTIAGISVGLADVVVSTKKKGLLAHGDEKVAQIQDYFNRGLLTEDERYRLVIDVWSKVKDEIQHVLMNELPAENHIYMMSDSGARGNASNFTQLAGMRGLMANPSGKTIELPIKSSFREGLTVTEFFISTHGARKGLADTALKTADSGYLTRRLVDVAQDVIIREEDCGTDRAQYIEEIKQRGQTIENLFDRIVGRYTAKPVFRPGSTEKLIDRNEYVTDEIAKEIVELGIEGIHIRSIYSCNAQKGVCKKCYGRNLATGKDVEVGEAVGIMAAQSIGEPGTQLTMRTFHTGGVAGADITQGLPRIQELFEARNPKGRAVIAEIDGVITSIKANTKNRYEVLLTNKFESRSYLLAYGAQPLVAEGDDVKSGDMITEGSIDPKELLRVKDVESVQAYILKEVQNVYRAQGVELSDKHIEIMVHQMMKKVKIIDGGDTDILPGSLIDITHYTRVNRLAIGRGKRPAVGIPTILGITKASLETESFLSAASFQETTRVLTDAAIKGKIDELVGLKENVIIGKLIPAGTGVLKEQHIQAVHEDTEDLDEEEVRMEPKEISKPKIMDDAMDDDFEDDVPLTDFDDTDLVYATSDEA